MFNHIINSLFCHGCAFVMVPPVTYYTFYTFISAGVITFPTSFQQTFFMKSISAYELKRDKLYLYVNEKRYTQKIFTRSRYFARRRCLLAVRLLKDFH